MQLTEFPQAIAIQQQILKNAKQSKEALEARLARLEGRIDYAIAFDTDLKNEAQRKAKRTELMSTEEIERAQIALTALLFTLAEAEIELTLLLNQFSVAKLAERRAIAAMELQATI